MFTGDSSADFLFRTLHRFGFASAPTSRRRDDGLTLHDTYITAALRCAPPGNKPSREELASCDPYLLEELSLLRETRVVVGLGKIAFDAYLRSCTARRAVAAIAPTKVRPRWDLRHAGRHRACRGRTTPAVRTRRPAGSRAEAFDAVFREVKRLLEA